VSLTRGPDRALYRMLSRRHFAAADLLHFLRALPPAPVPTVIALDNANVHRAHDVRDARPDLWRRAIFLYYLPPYSPELNDIERLFRTVKHHELPERTHPTLDGLAEAVDVAFSGCEAKLVPKHVKSPRKAA
jgi:transposase